MTFLIIAILVLHFAGCFLAITLGGTRLLKIRPAIFPLMLLVPVFGPAAAVLLGLYKRKNLADTDVEVPRFQLEAEIYRSMGMDSSGTTDVVPLEEAMILNLAGTRRNLMMDLVKENVVPLEEALTISTSQVRRKLMMDVLNSDTVKFYGLLEQARLNDDVEVVHYATTAMSELNKKYDQMLEKYRMAVEADPDDAAVLESCCGALRQYLALGLAKGAMLSMRRGECITMLSRLCKVLPTRENYCNLARQLLLGGDFASGDSTLLEAEDRWPDNEEVWLLRLEYFARLGEGKTVQKMASAVWNGDVYLSTKAKEQLSFWLKKGGRI